MSRSSGRSRLRPRSLVGALADVSINTPYNGTNTYVFRPPSCTSVIGTPSKKYELRAPLAERLDEAAESEEMESNDLLDYIVRRYLDELWIEESSDEGDDEEQEAEEEE